MSFFNSIKQAFGFGPDRDIEIEGIDATVRPLSQRRRDAAEIEVPGKRPSQGEESASRTSSRQQVDNDEQLQLKIFDTVVKVFNDSLPPFFKESVDPEAQKRHIYNALDASVKEYLRTIEENTRKRLRGQLERDRQRYESEGRELRDKIKSMDEKVETQRQNALSAERQKRALTERVRDLEGQVNTLMAEKEQFELENKSLLNKLRLSSVNGDSGAEPDPKLAEQIETLRVNNEVANRMVSEFKATASQAMADLKAKDEELAAVKAQLSRAQANIKEMDEAIAEIGQINDQLDQFEKIKRTKDKRIKELTAENERLLGLVEAKKKEVKSLQRTIEENLHANAEAQADLRRQIDMLRDETPMAAPSAPARKVIVEATPPKPGAAKAAKRKPSKPVITAIDESLDDTDWLVSTPPPGLTIAKDGDDDFGYVAPERKPMPENDAQMTLF